MLRDPIVHWTLALARTFEFLPRGEHQVAAPVSLDLHVHDNSVDVTGVALVGWHVGTDDYGSAIVNANRLTGSMQTMPTGLLVNLRDASVTGNVLVNRAHAEDRRAAAFVLSHGSRRCLWAVSGNAHEGEFLLPPEGPLGITQRLFRP